MEKDKFYKGESIIFSVEISKQLNHIKVDPTSVKITISFGTVIKVNNMDMTKESIGKYYYDWISDVVGICNVLYTVMDGTRVTLLKDIFTVII
jgi:hypothetical protein